MRSNISWKCDGKPGRSGLALLFILSAGLLMFSGVGCAHLNDPWKDSSAAIDADMTTPSTQGYEARPAEARSIQRTWDSSDVVQANGAVTHWPLWFEDPFEDKGNRDRPPASGNEDEPDNVFAMNWVDYMHMGYGPGRLFLNTIGWPISAVVTPPGTLMESDGRLSKGLLGYDHDAQRADSATREPPDVNILDRRPFTEEPTDDEHVAPPQAPTQPDYDGTMRPVSR